MDLHVPEPHGACALIQGFWPELCFSVASHCLLLYGACVGTLFFFQSCCSVGPLHAGCPGLHSFQGTGLGKQALNDSLLHCHCTVTTNGELRRRSPVT